MSTPDELWMQDGACHGYPEYNVFFSEQPVDVAKAKEVCFGCPVRDTCLDYSIRTRQEHGTWGGVPEGTRRRMIRRSSVLAHG